MNIKKIIVGLTLSLLLISGVASAASFDKGLQAYHSGDYKAAITEWTSAAEQGDADA